MILIQNFPKSPFLKLKILSYAHDNLYNDSPAGRGFISINTLVREASDIRISYEAIEDSLIKLAKYGLIILDTRSRASLDGASYFQITEGGIYYLNILINRFAYLDLIWVDTPISDIDLVRELRKYLNLRDIEKRFDRAKMFIEYLTYMENMEMQLNPEYLESKLGIYKYTFKMKKSFDYQKNYIRRRLREKYFYRYSY